ncbi:unnamed protein product [Closterium sp. Naga37s-1]|nr:unnamed protein product [Closterium sp. Naga37s-1]CAI5537003.1 unnamed protein product [Closterium sp. Naga37s-1]
MASRITTSLVGSAAVCGISSSFSSTRRGANVLKMWRRAIAWRVGRFSEKEQCATHPPRASLGFSPLRPKPVAKPPSKKPRPRDVMGTAAAVKPRAVHSGQATVAAAAAKATAAKATPAKTTEAKPTSVKATPAKAKPVNATLAKVTPAKATSTKATPAKATPAKATPIKAAPSKVTQAKATPTKVAPPTKAVPAKATAAKVTPAGPTATVDVKAASAKGVVGEMGGEVEECGELEWGGMA